VAKALDAAVRADYCEVSSPVAAMLRNTAMFAKVKPRDYWECKLAPFPLALGAKPEAPGTVATGSPVLSLGSRQGSDYQAGVLGHPEGPLRPVAPERLRIRGRGDGSDIKILNFEELVFEAKEDTVLADTIIPRGTRLARENGAWVLKNPPFGQ
jgi:hypothetical protein